MLEFCVPFTKDANYPFYVDSIGVTFCWPSYSIVRPNSPHYCFEYILNGQGYVQKDNLPVFSVQKNDLFILPMNHRHYFYTDPQKPWAKIWLVCSGDFVSNTLNAYRLENTCLVKNINLRKCFFRIYNICKNGNSKAEIFDKCAHIFLELVQSISIHNAAEKINQAENNIAQQVKKIMDNTDNINIPLKSISNMVYCSIPHIIDSFKAEYGMTPHQYSTQMKIKLAKNYLTNTNLSIMDIAFRLKFDNAHYFSTFFKSKTGVTPKEFRLKLNSEQTGNV